MRQGLKLCPYLGETYVGKRRRAPMLPITAVQVEQFLPLYPITPDVIRSCPRPHLLLPASNVAREPLLHGFSPSILLSSRAASTSLLSIAVLIHDIRAAIMYDARRASAASADQALARLGYTSELPRNLSMLSILGLSFAIMAVPFGLSTTLYITLTNGEAVTVLYGWILVSLISLCIAASLAEICAVFPTAGGVYYWSAMLSTQQWAPLVSFVDGWLTLVGNWTVTLSINFSGAQLILSGISIFNEDFVANEWQTVLCFWAWMLICAAVNAFGSRYLDLINKVCIYWTAASVVTILVTLLVLADDKRSAEYVFSHYDASASGWPSGWSFFVGLLQGELIGPRGGLIANNACSRIHPDGIRNGSCHV